MSNESHEAHESARLECGMYSCCCCLPSFSLSASAYPATWCPNGSRWRRDFLRPDCFFGGIEVVSFQRIPFSKKNNNDNRKRLIQRAGGKNYNFSGGLIDSRNRIRGTLSDVGHFDILTAMNVHLFFWGFFKHYLVRGLKWWEFSCFCDVSGGHIANPV